MKRSEMIEHMINLIESTPEGASMYHRMDILLSRMERLGMSPPPYCKQAPVSSAEWELGDD